MRRLVADVVEFVVGEDVWIAVAVLALLGATGVLVGLGDNPWWALPVGVPLSVWISLRRARR